MPDRNSHKFVHSFRFALPAGMLFTKRNEYWAWSQVNVGDDHIPLCDGDYEDDKDNDSLRGNRFHAVSEQRTRNESLRLREKWVRTKNPAPCRSYRYFFAPKPHGNACYAGYGNVMMIIPFCYAANMVRLSFKGACHAIWMFSF